MTKLKKRIILVVGLILLYHIIAIAITTHITVLPNVAIRFRNYYPNLAAATPHEKLLLRSSDGLDVHALWFENKNTDKTLLFCHGRSRSKTHEMPYVQKFMDSYDILTIDFRSHGDDEFNISSVGYHEANDVTGALNWLEGTGVTEVAVIGHSMGGAAAIKALSLYESDSLEIKALITEGTFANMEDLLGRQIRRTYTPPTVSWPGLKLVEVIADYKIADNSPEKFVTNIVCPVMFLQGDRDYLSPEDSPYRLYDAANEPKEMYIFTGKHDTPCEEVEDRIDDFLMKHFPGHRHPGADDPHGRVQSQEEPSR